MIVDSIIDISLKLETLRFACFKEICYQAGVDMHRNCCSGQATPDEISYNAAIVACGKESWEASLQVFERRCLAQLGEMRERERERESKRERERARKGDRHKSEEREGKDRTDMKRNPKACSEGNIRCVLHVSHLLGSL